MAQKHEDPADSDLFPFSDPVSEPVPDPDRQHLFRGYVTFRSYDWLIAGVGILFLHHGAIEVHRTGDTRRDIWNQAWITNSVLRIRDLGSSAFFTPESGMEKKSV